MPCYARAEDREEPVQDRKAAGQANHRSGYLGRCTGRLKIQHLLTRRIACVGKVCTRADGKKQKFITPGLMLGSVPIEKRLRFTVGFGYQIAVTSFHQYDHRRILSLRLRF
jgi:hypothetical protein